MLAAQFGYAPGLIWLVAGVCLAGAVHDFIILWASTRRGGRSLAEIARAEIGPVAGATAAVAILFIIVIALAGLGLAVVNALAGERLGHVHDRRLDPARAVHGPLHVPVPQGPDRGSDDRSASLGLFLAVILGKPLAASSFGPWFHLSREQLIVAMAAYGFVASVLPVWMLLCPRDYLSSFMKIGTIAFLVVAVIIVNPELQMPAFSQFVGGGGPIIPGPLFPFVFITIACGAISGFHALIASGTTPKMIDRESRHPPDRLRRDADRRARRHRRADRRDRDVPRRLLRHQHAAGGRSPTSASRSSTCRTSQAAVGETVDRPPGRRGLARGRHGADLQRPARHARPDGLLVSLRDHVRGAVHPHDDRHRHARRPLPGAGVPRALLRRRWRGTTGCPGSVVSTLLVVAAWGYFIWTGSISTIWPMFGIANQLLAVGRAGRRHDDHHQHGQGAVRVGDAAAAVVRVGDDADGRGPERPRQLLADGRSAPNPATHFQGYVNTALTVIMMVCVVVILDERRVALDAGAARKDRCRGGNELIFPSVLGR